MNKKTRMILASFFIFQSQVVFCSFFINFLTFGSQQSAPAMPVVPGIIKKDNPTNDWVGLEVDSAGSISDKTIERFVTIISTAKIIEIEASATTQRSTHEYIQERNQKRASSLPRRLISDQTNPKRKPRSLSTRPNQNHSQTQTSPTRSQQPSIISIVLKRPDLQP